MSLSVEIAHRFPGLTLELGFDAPEGVTALIGRSGAGKTTVANVVAGLMRPDRARVRLGDVTLADTTAGLWLSPQVRRIGYVFQEARLFPHLSVRQNLLYGARRRSRLAEAEGELPGVTELLGIGGLLTRRPGALSGGERQRVAIGRALLSGPRMLLLDEPLAALDPARKAEILPFLERLRDHAGLPILYVSHAMEEVARLATTVVALDAGRVVAQGPASAVLSDPAAVPALDPGAAGAVIEAVVEAQDSDGLTRVAAAGGTLYLPQIAAEPGARLRLRIEAQDVMISRDRPEGLSALNLIAARIISIHPGHGPGALVRLKAGEAVILSRITQRSVAALGLAEGQGVHAVIKSLAMASDNVGTARVMAGQGDGR
ncbi:molybdenum ABC transporter ATP-binding protein [Roseicyclus amphidinii]|uniref:molybdenum ABC transporter ATP-binding protein n=1 Tax=Roseicyclus amphidinii TaxID=3034232 RepID=UPI0024E08845|nr:molybdenum ABC transporter ATP-binding protein [Roseicyclus sp. Amp-Y-6]